MWIYAYIYIYSIYIYICIDTIYQNTVQGIFVFPMSSKRLNSQQPSFPIVNRVTANKKKTRQYKNVSFGGCRDEISAETHKGSKANTWICYCNTVECSAESVMCVDAFGRPLCPPRSPLCPRFRRSQVPPRPLSVRWHVTDASCQFEFKQVSQ